MAWPGRQIPPSGFTDSRSTWKDEIRPSGSGYLSILDSAKPMPPRPPTLSRFDDRQSNGENGFISIREFYHFNGIHQSILLIDHERILICCAESILRSEAASGLVSLALLSDSDSEGLVPNEALIRRSASRGRAFH